MLENCAKFETKELQSHGGAWSHIVCGHTANMAIQFCISILDLNPLPPASLANEVKVFCFCRASANCLDQGEHLYKLCTIPE